MEHAIIDVGSNSIRLVVYDVDSKKDEPNIIYNNKIMAGLASYIDEDGTMSERGIKRAVNAINAHLNQARKFHVASTSVFATACIRNASNSKAIRKRIDKDCNIKMTVLSGDEEAQLGLEGALHTIESGCGVLFDMGGGSTEITYFSNRKSKTSVSLPLGSLNLFLNHVEGLFPTEEEVHAIRAEMNEALEDLIAKAGRPCTSLFGIGGSVRAVAKLDGVLHHDGETPAGITAEEIENMLTLAYEPGNTTLRTVLSIAPNRVHTIFPGMAGIAQIVSCFKADEVHVAKYGVREGFLYDRVLS